MPITIALVNIGTSDALGIILSIFNSALIVSYIITIGCAMSYRLSGKKLPRGRYSLGNWGTLVNIFALVFMVPILIFSFFPSAPKPRLTLVSMNWAVAMVGGVGILATVYYIIRGRKSYTPPVITVESYIEKSG
jgi:choline transport protein